MQRFTHNIPPVFSYDSKVLILGSFPSRKSRESQFYYGHPQNRFWKIISSIFDEPIPKTEAEKKSILISHNIALWDVISECDIEGSSDVSIKNACANDIQSIINHSCIQLIVLNGKTAANLYKRFFSNKINKINTIVLPSTSPANATYSFDKLLTQWTVILKYNT